MGRGSAVVLLLGGVVLLLGGVLACGGVTKRSSIAQPKSTAPARSGPVYIPHELDIAGLEVKRANVTGRLIKLTNHRDVRVRLRAVVALGRVAGRAATARLHQLVQTATPAVRAAAVGALGVTSPLMRSGEKAALARVLVRVLRATRAPQVRVAALRELGRIGAATVQPLLAGALADRLPVVQRAAALALARFGRRKIAMDQDVRSTLRTLSLAKTTPASVRWATTYALAQEHAPSTNDHATMFALTRLSRHATAVVRAVALRGLSRRYQPVAYDERKPFLVSLRDRDWRVRVQAVRALAQPPTNAEDHAALATWLVRELMLHLVNGQQRIQAVVEGLNVLAKFARESPVQTAADAIFQLVRKRMRAGERTEALRLSVSMVHCLSAALRVRGGANFSALNQCGGARDRGWPNHLRRQLEIQVIAAGFGGTQRQRFERLYSYASAKDVRVRAAALTGLATLADVPAFATVVSRALRTAMADKAIEVVAAVAEVTDAMLGQNAALARVLVDTALARFTSPAPVDAELHITLLGLFAKAKLMTALSVCRRGYGATNASVRHAGRQCIVALTGQDPGMSAAAIVLAPPPVDVKAVVGYAVSWTVHTTRGVVTIALDSRNAPWHVATVVALTRRKLYDGLLWHRVVADFVVQGGDPRGSGWGGPGFVVPAEPSTLPFDTGSVGIADAGLDTGGSQWFVMHSPAPRLDNRYTQIGRIVSGQRVVDSLVMGDRITRATIRITPRP